jgi:AraC family transcriptional regulator of arabinose operon
MAIQSGFPGERINVLPRPRVEEALKEPINERLIVTDCGYFPKAIGHERVRPQGCCEAIIIVCVDGRGWAELPGSSVSIRPGQALVVAPGIPHSYGASEEDPWSIWWMHVKGVDIDMLLEEAGVTSLSPIINARDLTRLVGLIEEIIQLSERDDSPSTILSTTGAAWHLLTLLASSQNTQIASRLDPIQVSMNHLQLHYSEGISVSKLAREAGLSVSHFSTLFSLAAGCGPLAYQARLRMMKARQLLDTTDLPISSISRQVGYQDPLYFSRKFQVVHGVSASEHRSRAKG